jgi:hypothetical protein
MYSSWHSGTAVWRPNNSAARGGGGASGGGPDDLLKDLLGQARASVISQHSLLWLRTVARMHHAAALLIHRSLTVPLCCLPVR